MQGPDHRTVIPSTLHPRDQVILVVSLALSLHQGLDLNTLLRADLHLHQVLHRLSSLGLPRLAPTPPPLHLQLMDLHHHPPHQALDLHQARPPTAWHRLTSRHQLPLPSRGQLPPLTPGRPMLRLLTTRPLTRPTLTQAVPPHLTTTRRHSQDIRDIHQHRDIQVGHMNLTGYFILILNIHRISTNHRLSWRLSWKLSPSSSSPAGTPTVWLPRRPPSRLSLQASSWTTRRSHEPSSTCRLPGLRPEQIRAPAPWLWSSPALVISHSDCSSKHSYGNLKKSLNVLYSVSSVCTCTYVNIASSSVHLQLGDPSHFDISTSVFI